MQLIVEEEKAWHEMDLIVYHQFYNESSSEANHASSNEDMDLTSSTNHASSRVPYFCSPCESKKRGTKFWHCFWQYHLEKIIMLINIPARSFAAWTGKETSFREVLLLRLGLWERERS